MYFARRNARVSPEPNYCLTKFVGTRNYGVVRHNNPLAFEENAIMIVFDVPFTLVERVTISLGTAIPAKVVLQRLKPRLQWVARPLAGWITDQNNGRSE
jgi:hypothetical protein